MSSFKYWGRVLWTCWSGERIVRAIDPGLLTRQELSERLEEVKAAGFHPRVYPYDWVVVGGDGLRVESDSGAEFFDDLCNVAIYHFADLCRRSGSLKSRSNRRLTEAGFADAAGHILPEAVYGAYELAVIGYARHVLGEGWIRQWDHWGAACLHRGEIPRGDQRRDHVAAGDDCGRIMFFDGFYDLKEYMSDAAAKEVANSSRILDRVH